MASKTVTTPENKAKVLALIADGLSVREIARKSDMPSGMTIHRWINGDEKFSEQSARARVEASTYRELRKPINPGALRNLLFKINQRAQHERKDFSRKN